MIDESPKRFDRIVAILIQLQSSRVVKAQELADRFQVSLRTIYRDIRSLESSGVPILSETGTGYSIMEGYRLPPVMFTREEAGSFVAAEKLMQQMTDKTLGAYFCSAMFKVKSVLRNKDKDWITALESQILVKPYQELFNKNIPDALEIIMEGIASQKQVSLLYQAFTADEPGQRTIEPVGLFHEHNYWYVLGFCHLRQDYRQFRTDRIVQIRRTELPYLKEHDSLEQLRSKEYVPEGKILVRILVDKKIGKYIKSSKSYYGFLGEEDRGSQMEMSFMTSCTDEGFARWYMMFGDYAEILEPESLKVQVQQLAMKVIASLGILEPVLESETLTG
ncbi:DNA-binding protein [Pedobacter sp. PACM 27299]|uniref:helix-turn-helix transcriptional regulator n=1 Tax=Pedobacter sp. PACM 27299 TaxID=1727164 RepID=UPI000705A9AF|nr:YafY family protein [Pedobacter sp. PACM 27299]ALL06383.1 DNA-binding protein [Pedobacter sp. PACM 27299]